MVTRYALVERVSENEGVPGVLDVDGEPWLLVHLLSRLGGLPTRFPEEVLKGLVECVS